jgi:PAS domain S-box-containing protein
MLPDLFASGSLFARIFSASPVAMALFARADGRCVAANDAFARLFGYSTGDLLGRHTDELGLLDHETWRSVGRTVVESGQLTDRLLQVYARDGAVHDVLASIQTAEWDGVAYLITLLQDLTQYNRARRALSDAEARFRLFFESIPLPVVVFDSESLVILDINAMTEAQYGYSRDDLLGRPALVLWPPAQQPAWAAALRAAGAPSGPTEHVRRDGTPLMVEASSQTVTLDGRSVRLATFADVTEQRANEAARRHSEQQLRIIADVTTDVIWDFDLRQQIAHYSSGMSTLFGHDAGARPAPSWWLSHIHPDDRDRVQRELRAAIPRAGGLWTSRYRFRRADGSYAHVLDRGYALPDSGDGVRVIGAMVDITRQIELQEAAARATQAERQRLARDLHDAVTQSVYSLTLMTEAARRRATLGEPAAAFQYVDRLSELARQALKEMRLLVYELQPAALQDEPLVAALQARLDAVEQRAGVQTRLRVEADLHLPPAIETQLFHVTEEALNNALKHAAATTVEVVIGGDARHVTLEIRDNGIGFQPPAASTPSGLGLVSMRERVDNLGGTFEVTTHPGQGTTVRVSLELGNGENGQSDPNSNL